jgi:hypothetical protein
MEREREAGRRTKRKGKEGEGDAGVKERGKERGWKG